MSKVSVPHEAREYIGGPLHGEWIVVESVTSSQAVPLTPDLRQNPSIPEWACYRQVGDDMIFLGVEHDLCSACELMMRGGTQ